MEPETQATPPHAQAPAQTPAATPPAEKPAPEPTVTITVAQYQAQVERDRKWAEVEAAQAAELDKRDQARIKALAEKGDVEKALGELRDKEQKRFKELEEKHTGLLQSLADEKRDATISSFLAGHQFVGETDAVRQAAAKDFQDVVRGRFSASQDAQGKWSVIETATGRPAGEVLAEQVKARPYLFAATTQGGANGGGNTLGNEAKPNSLDAFAAAIREQKAQSRTFGLSRVG